MSSAPSSASPATVRAVHKPSPAGGPLPESVAYAPRAASPQPVPPHAPLDHPSLYLNRELSWLDFNWRVLHMAHDERVPLLERVRFLGLTADNLDGFVRKRVGGLKRQVSNGVTRLSPDGRTPEEQLALVTQAIEPLYQALGDTWADLLAPALEERIDLQVHNYETLSDNHRADLEEHFRKHIFPILTPLAVDPGRPFPFISNMSLSLAVVLRHPERGSRHFARVKVPTSRNRWLPLASPLQFVPIEQVIAQHVDALFRGMEVEGAYAFRVTRNADVLRNDKEADDLLEMVSERLRERRFAPVVRLEVREDMPPFVRDFLEDKLEIASEDVYVADGLIDLSDMTALADLHIPAERYDASLRFPRWTPVTPQCLQAKSGDRSGTSIFRAIRSGDVLLHHPYESFQQSVQHFVEEAARDPKVLAIKQTLYRTSEDSPIVAALVDAAERGKQVAVLVEVKARFDEEKNIAWARTLEDAGVHVAYGLRGLKTHAQATLVVRREEDGLRTYSHVSTGNYNTQTAREYTDYGLLTCDRQIGYDLTNLFHYLTGYAPEQTYQRLVVAPQAMRETFVQHIEQEIAHAQNGRWTRIIAKMNELADPEIIRALYRASQAGVQIDLIVRGICQLRPHIDGVSDNIRVVSIVGRFLEHERVFYFANNNDPRLYIGSADWQTSRLDARVEAAVPLQDPEQKARIFRTLRAALNDPRTAWELQPDGRFLQRTPDTDDALGLQETLMKQASDQAMR